MTTTITRKCAHDGAMCSPVTGDCLCDCYACKARRGEPSDRLSRVASAIWQIRTFVDPFGDPSGEAGAAIRASEREAVLRTVRDAGYASPGEYNADLRARLTSTGEPENYRAYLLLTVLSVDEVCPFCGSALDVQARHTRAYGGGYDTFVRCPSCDYAEVCV